MTTSNRDVVIVGGGPAGCAVGVCIARYGLDVVIFDRGNSSLRRCAFLENYLGFPAGIDIETFYKLMHDHAVEAGCDLVSDMVESVERTDGNFRVRTQEERSVLVPRVVAATTHDGEYLRGLDSDEVMFDTHEHHGEVHEEFDREYADADGRTSIDGLYVAGGLAGHGEQVLVAAGHGMTVGRELLADVRCEEGYWEEAAPHYDWLRRRAALDYDWDDEETWHRRFADHRVADDHDIEQERLQRIRQREIEFVKSTHLDRSEIDNRRERAHRRLATHLDEELLLEVIDDDRLQEYVAEQAETTGSGGRNISD
ncbi:NAD(P)/FAD-dependent oxidoreductase [Halogeometricum borinquense]|uniref:NAD(P)/FAD-dependent oxidoreductase n=1 Tax=Halogeometricum borinquense TaxID=60847 RepID=A0A482T8V6_9EURY|nr:NAD(P)/FAD-dependent oxidoreductase [Halogeometricum borinquense]RYJ14304.1 NAD(P)/FAD-dependent oxidoreductase [Halogeometricum borinquense]